MSDLRGARGMWRVDPESRREGGQAEVLRGVGPDGATVAVRLPKSATGTGWFSREAALLRQLTTPGRPWVLPLLDEGTAPDGRPFIVLPWFEEALDEWLDRRPAIERVFEALTAACESVVRLHRAPMDLSKVLVHRDLKPSNFLVKDDGAELLVVLADLGIAKEGHLLAAATQTGMFTEHFAPPEQQLPLALASDPAMDVHGLAATVWYALCDRVPRAVFSRQAAWKEEAAELRALAALGRRRGAADEARFEELRRLPVEAFADFELMAALRPQDEQEFGQRLEAALAGRVDEPTRLAKQVAELLLPVLRRALEPDHRRRLGEAQRLYAAVRQARDLVNAAVAGTRGVATPAPVVVGPGGGTLVPAAGATFGGATGPPPGATGDLPVLDLDPTGPAAQPVRPAPVPEALRPRTDSAQRLDPGRTMDPFAEPAKPRTGVVLVAGMLAFAGVFVGVGLLALAVWAWPEAAGDQAPPGGEGGAAGAAELAAEVQPEAEVEPPTPPEPVVPKVDERKEKSIVEAEKAAEVAAEPTALRVEKVDPPAAPAAVPPVTLEVFRCAGSLDPGEVTLDDGAFAGTVPAGRHSLRVLAVDGATSTTIGLEVSAAGLAVRGAPWSGNERSYRFYVDDKGRHHASRGGCP